MDDVARELGISKKTLYEFFTDKADLVMKILQFQISKIQTVFNEDLNPGTNAIDHLFEISQLITSFFKNFSPTVHYDLQKYYPEVFQSFFEYKRDLMYKSVIINLNRGIKEGLYRSDINPDLIAHIYISRIEAFLFTSSLSGKEYTTNELFNEMFSYHIHGIASKKGIDYFEKKIGHANM